MVLAIHFFPFEAGHFAEKEPEKADRTLVLGAGGAFGLCCLCISCLHEKKKKKKGTRNRDQEPGVFSPGQVSLLPDTAIVGVTYRAQPLLHLVQGLSDMESG